MFIRKFPYLVFLSKPGRVRKRYVRNVNWIMVPICRGTHADLLVLFVNIKECPTRAKALQRVEKVRAIIMSEV